MRTYHGEKAIISLTSWKARIDTVSKTLFSLITMCPGFHIVLVLSEEEFPKKEKSLPKSLMAFVDNNLIELLWTRKNYKSFKKVLFTMDKYRNVPVISADDDCTYTCNYAAVLYGHWCRHKNSIFTVNPAFHYGIKFQHGPCTIYPPYAFRENGLKYLTNKTVIQTNHDDVYYGILAHKMHIPIITIPMPVPYKFHDETQALSRHRAIKCHAAIRMIIQAVK